VGFAEDAPAVRLNRKGEPLKNVLLCDGCDAEVHLRCSSLKTKPSSEEPYHCESCASRRLLAKQGHQALLEASLAGIPPDTAFAARQSPAPALAFGPGILPDATSPTQEVGVVVVVASQQQQQQQQQ
jgi:DNA-directed RNA polymerase subunit RPC12/RpoP